MRDPTDEIVQTKKWNEYGRTALVLCAVAFGVLWFGPAKGGEAAWCFWMAIACLVAASRPSMRFFSSASTARRWFRNRLGKRLHSEEADRYRFLFSGVGDPRPLLTRALEAGDEREALLLLRGGANAWAQVMNRAPPFPDEERIRFGVEQQQKQREEQQQRRERPSAEARHETYGGATFNYQYARARAERTGEKANHSSQSPPPESINVALTALGLGSMPANAEELRRAWRARMSEYHPDKFSGADAAVRRMAHEMTAQMNRAYEQIARSQGWQV